MKRTTKILVMFAAVAGTVGLAAAGWAYWTTSGSGAASATVGTLNAPTGVVASQPTLGVGTVHVAWTASSTTAPPAVAPTGYYVERFSGATPSAACGTSPTVLLTDPPTSCDDERLTQTGPFTYKVTAVFNSWTAQSTASNSISVVLDITPPTVSSIDRAAADPTIASSVSWTVTFSEDVTGVDSSDFALSSTGLTGPAIGPVLGAGDTWTVTAATGTGSGTLGLNLVDDNTIIDVASNPLGGPGGILDGAFTGQIYTIDRIAPTVTVDQKVGQADPANTQPIRFTVTFSESVVGFTPADVTRGGTATGGTVTVTGSGASYEIAVSGLISDGTVTASIPAGGVADPAGNTNTISSSTDNTVVYDGTAPSVTIDQKVGQADPTSTQPIRFTVTFSESVVGFTPADVTRGGTATGGTVTVIGSGANYELAVSGLTSDGTVTATIPAGGAQDGAGNSNTVSSSTDNTVTFDTTSPSVTINQAAGQADPVSTQPINFTVVFSEPVSFFAGSGVSLTGTAGGLAGATKSVTGGPSTYNVAVSGITSDGTVIATVLAGGAQDGAGNSNTVSSSTDNTVTLDATGPSVTVNQAAGQADPTDTQPINFTVVFSEPVSLFVEADVSLTGTAGGLAGATKSVTGGPSTYNVAVSGLTSDGTVTATVPAGGAQDGAANTNTVSTSTDNTVRLDTTGPTVTVDQKVGQADPTSTQPIRFTVTFSESVVGFTPADVTRGGTATGGTVTVIGSGANYEIAVSGLTSDGTVTATIPAGGAQDGAGNSNTVSSSTDNTVTFDTTSPSVTINQAAGQADPVSTQPINFTVVFSEPVSFFAGSGVSLTGTAGGLAGATKSVTGGPSTYNVAVSGITSDGTVVATVLAGGAQDGAGNPNTVSTSTDNSVTYETVAPTVTVNQKAGQVDPTNTLPVLFTVTFSEPVTGFDAADLTSLVGRAPTTSPSAGSPPTARSPPRSPLVAPRTVPPTPTRSRLAPTTR